MIVVIFASSYSAINAFLNSGRGGTVFIGVEDSGAVLGVSLSVFQVSKQTVECTQQVLIIIIFYSTSQREHIQVAVEDLLYRYNPPVPCSLFKVTQLSGIPQIINLHVYRSTCIQEIHVYKRGLKLSGSYEKMPGS